MYGIRNEVVYNFNETSFRMGMISSQVVVIGSKRRNRRKAIQLGDREWAIVIQGVNVIGWSIPPFIILKAKHYLSTWY